MIAKSLSQKLLYGFFCRASRGVSPSCVIFEQPSPSCSINVDPSFCSGRARSEGAICESFRVSKPWGLQQIGNEKRNKKKGKKQKENKVALGELAHSNDKKMTRTLNDEKANFRYCRTWEARGFSSCQKFRHNPARSSLCTVWTGQKTFNKVDTC